MYFSRALEAINPFYMAVKLLSSKKNFHKIKLTSDQYKKKHIFEQISLPPTLTQIPLQEKPPLHPPKKNMFIQ